MQTKYKLPKDIYQATLWIIRGQERRIKEYEQKRNDIINGGGAKYITYTEKDSGEQIRAYLPSPHSNQSATEIKAHALVALENKSETIKMNCVNQALDDICSIFSDDTTKENFKDALMKNICNRKKYPFHRLGNLYMSEKTFYSYKAKFIYLVAKKIDMI